MKTFHTLLLLCLLTAAGCSENLPSDPGADQDGSGGNGRIFFTHWLSEESYEVRSVESDGTGMRTVVANAIVTDVRKGRMAWGSEAGFFVGASDGSGAVLIPGGYGRPRLSPDGSMIAFGAYDGSFGWELRICSSTGANVRTITDDFDYESIAAWSPDGKQIAIHRRDDALCVVDVATGAVNVLDTLAFGYNDFWVHIDWSRDGQRLAYIGRRQSGSYETDIFTIRPDGTERTRVTNDTLGEFFPHWTRDGSAIIFGSAQGLGFHLVRIGREGGSRTDLTKRFMNSKADLVPRLSADGTKLLYTAYSSDWENSPGTLYMLDLASGGARKLSDSAMFGFWENGGY